MADKPEDGTEEFNLEGKLDTPETIREYVKRSMLEEMRLNEMQDNGYLVVLVNSECSRLFTYIPEMNENLVTNMAVELFGAFAKYLEENYEAPMLVFKEIVKEYVIQREKRDD